MLVKVLKSATAIMATIKPYSMAVAPSSLSNASKSIFIAYARQVPVNITSKYRIANAVGQIVEGDNIIATLNIRSKNYTIILL